MLLKNSAGLFCLITAFVAAMLLMACTSPAPTAVPSPTAVVLATVPATNCPLTPAPLLLNMPLLADAQLVAYSADGQERALVCQHTNGYGRCQQYALPLHPDDEGLFSLRLTDLGQTSPMQIIDDRVSYSYVSDTFTLSYGMQQTRIPIQGAQPVLIDVPISRDEIGCPLVEFTAVSHTLEPDPATQQVNINQLGNLLITDLSADECQQTAVLTPIRYQITLPASTHLNDVLVQYWRDDAWQTAVCQVERNQYICTAQLPNPLINQRYSTRVLLDDESYIGTELPAMNLCIWFGQ